MRRERRQVLYVLGAALLLSGCQPTTDTVIVKPKSAIAGAKLLDGADAGDVPEQVQAPASCTLDLMAENGTVRIQGTAKVTVPQVDGIRLKKTETRTFEQADMDNLKENLFMGGELTQRSTTEEQDEEGLWLTKEEILQIIHTEERMLEKAEKEPEKTDVDPGFLYEELEGWKERYRSAPLSFREKTVSTKVSYDKYAAERFSTMEMEGNANVIWGGTKLGDISYNFFMNNNWSSELRNVTACLTRGYPLRNFVNFHLYTSDGEYYGDDSMPEELLLDAFNEKAIKYDGGEENGQAMGETEAMVEWYRDFAEATEGRAEEEWILDTPLETLKSKGDALAGSLGFDSFALAGWKRVGMYDDYSGLNRRAVNLIYMPVVDGIPVTYADYRFCYDNEREDCSELLQIAYDDEGLAQLQWQNPTRIYDMSDDYVFLLPFSDILKTFEEQAPQLQSTNAGEAEEYGYSAWEQGRKLITITDIKLGYVWVPDDTMETEGMLIPAWDFIGRQTNGWLEGTESGGYWENPSPYQSFLTVNAMDGTVVEGALRLYSF